MKTQTGIWLDKEKAIIINLSGGKHTIKTIESNIDMRERYPGETKRFGRFGSQFLSLENKKKNRTKKQIAKFVQSIIEEIKKSEEIVVLGPAEMKTILKKAILENNDLAENIQAVISADSMTENQLVAWVKKYYDDKNG